MSKLSTNPYRVTNEFEEALANYTGSTYAVCLDSMSNALFLSLYYEHRIKKACKNYITIP